MRTVWRLTDPAYRDTAFTGDGAREFGGRWTPEGWRAVYCAESRALAILEFAVHLPPTPISYERLLFEVRIPERVAITALEEDSLPDGWRAMGTSSLLHPLGVAWLEAAETAVLEVPSAIVPAERNYVLNPAHPDFARIRVGAPEPYELDRRLARQRS